mmetsp:Transcript_5271/g.18381  ORF Transcript_5271/g.18381 Transcript_5271/m.18381 type:complete len:129 (+) Transcript_5271:80-466(+)
MAALALYRKTTLGTSLDEALVKMVVEQTIPPHIAEKTLEQFDQSMAKAMEAQTSNANASIKGTINTFKNTDNTWILTVQDAVVRTMTPGGAPQDYDLDAVKIVACGTAPVAPARHGRRAKGEEGAALK